MKKHLFRGGVLLILAGALLFRVTGLGRRPMHHDEANQAVKFGALLEHGDYRYDPSDHHGPSLYYLTLPAARAVAGRDFAALDESDLRMVTAIFGWGVVLLVIVLMRPLGMAAALAAGALTALSPAAVFFSRFYIQETLLVFFTAGLILCGWRYRIRPSKAWALAAGLCAGLMFATKETSVILFGAMAGALLLTMLRGGAVPGVKTPLRRVRFHHGWFFLGGAALAAFLLFSSFLSNLPGAHDSVSAFNVYFQRAGEAGWHNQPWHYYLGMMTWFRHGGGPVWSEALILGLGVVGMVSTFRRSLRAEPENTLARFLVFYTLLATAVYSLISYKTPWNLLPFHLGWLCLAGWGAARLGGSRRLRALAVFLVLTAGLWHLGRQSGLAVGRYAADPRNPYVYAHTSTDFLRLVERINDLSQVHPDGRRMLIRVIAEPDRTWPLPWYLRGFERVGYWTDSASAGDVTGTPVIVSSAPQAERLAPRLGADYFTEFYGLRPEVLIAVHIRRDLWEAFMRGRRR